MAVKGEDYTRVMFKDTLLKYHLECDGEVEGEPSWVPFSSDPIIELACEPYTISGFDIYATFFHRTEDMDCHSRYGFSKQTADEIVRQHEKKHIKRTIFYEYSFSKAGEGHFTNHTTELRKKSFFCVDAKGAIRARAISKSEGLHLAKETPCKLSLFAYSNSESPAVRLEDAIVTIALACTYESTDTAKCVEPSWIAEADLFSRDGSFGPFSDIISTAPKEKAARSLEEFLRMMVYERMLALHGDEHRCPKCGYLFKLNATDDIHPVPPKFCGPWLIRDRYCPNCCSEGVTSIFVNVYRNDFHDGFAADLVLKAISGRH